MTVSQDKVSPGLWIIVIGAGVFLTAHSQTFSGFFDESFHLVAAQLINSGKRPYVDFFYQHTPLYAYACALWMRVFGDSWRSVHMLSSLLATACVALVGAYTFATVPDRRWRCPAAATAAVLVGFDTLVVRFATIGQPYAFCLLLIVASFLLSVRSLHRPRSLTPFWAGLSAGGAAAASLLTVPVVPIELVWMLRYARDARDRPGIAGRFAAGAAVAIIPFLWLFLKAPGAAFFDTVEYHAFYRGWPSAHATGVHELRVFSSWIHSPQALLLLLLAAGGLISMKDRSQWDERRRAELSLCAWLAAGLALYMIIPYPTFEQYFIFVVPFLSILAAVGIRAIGSRVWPRGRPVWVTLAVCAVFLLGLAMSIRRNPYFYRGMYWPGVEEAARAINRVTPRDGLLYSDDGNVYFAARRAPPPGLENAVAADLSVSPSFAHSLHVVLQPQLDSSLRAGRFASVLICSIQDRIDSLGLAQLYAHRDELRRSHCSLFWDR